MIVIAYGNVVNLGIFFDGIIKKDKFLIITKLEFYDILYIWHDKNGHKE